MTSEVVGEAQDEPVIINVEVRVPTEIDADDLGQMTVTDRTGQGFGMLQTDEDVSQPHVNGRDRTLSADSAALPLSTKTLVTNTDSSAQEFGNVAHD